MASEQYRRQPESAFGRATAAVSRFANDHVRLVLLGPALVSLVVIFVYPVAFLVWSSFHRTLGFGFGTEWAPAANYARMLADPTFWNAAGNTLSYSVGSFLVTMLAGLVIALALDQVARKRLRDTYTTLILLSWAVPLSIVGVTWRWMFNGQLGVVNKLLLDLGVLSSSFSWLGHPNTAMAIVVLADSWSRIPFAAIVILAGLQSIPQETYDAAKVDGATTLQTFRHVTLPYLRPSFFVAGLITWMFAFRAFAIPFSTTGGGPAGATEVLAIYIHRFGIQQTRYGFASAVSVFLVLVTLVVASFYVTVILEQISEIEE